MDEQAFTRRVEALEAQFEQVKKDRERLERLERALLIGRIAFLVFTGIGSVLLFVLTIWNQIRQALS